jgi:hypothetical protein
MKNEGMRAPIQKWKGYHEVDHGLEIGRAYYPEWPIRLEPDDPNEHLLEVRYHNGETWHKLFTIVDQEDWGDPSELQQKLIYEARKYRKAELLQTWTLLAYHRWDSTGGSWRCFHRSL